MTGTGNYSPMAGTPGGTTGTSIRDLTRVRLTRLDKVLYPAAGITKEEVGAWLPRRARRRKAAG